MTEGEASALPLLGESLALDAVNSLYGVEPDVVDFLDDTRIDSWVEGLAGVHQLSPGAIHYRNAPELRAVRDAAWIIVHAALDGTRPPAGPITTINEAARRAPAVVALTWSAAGPSRDARSGGPRIAPLDGILAVATIELVTGPDAARLRPCARPGCSMLFLQDHGRRRFCHPSCSHIVRQNRYRYRHPGGE